MLRKVLCNFKAEIISKKLLLTLAKTWKYSVVVPTIWRNVEKDDRDGQGSEVDEPMVDGERYTQDS